MSDWDTVVGEAALGMDLAKVDAVRDSLGHVLASRGGRSSVLTPSRPPLERPPLERQAAVGINPDTIFRQEALEFRARGHDTHGGVVRLGSRWIRWGYRITVAALAASMAGTLVIRTSESASGPAVVDGRTGTVAALLPAAAGPDLAHSRGITVTLPGGRAVQLSSPHADLADGATVRRAGLVPPAQPAILVTGRLSSAAAAAAGASGPAAQTARLRAEASVVLRSESLASVLARQFKSMLGLRTSP
jgi:hypothetical protein